MKKLILLLLLSFPMLVFSQTVGRLPYKQVLMSYKGDTLYALFDGDSVRFVTNKKWAFKPLLQSGGISLTDTVNASKNGVMSIWSWKKLISLASTSTGLSSRGYYDASVNVFPSTGGSGISGAILKGDYWAISVKGILGGDTVSIGATITAMFDSPGQTFSNWNILQANLGFTPENSQNKVTVYSASYLNSKTKYPSMWFLNNYYSLDSIIINPAYKYRNWVLTNNGTNNYVSTNNGTNNFVSTNNSGGYNNRVSTNNGTNNFVSINSSGGYNNWVSTNNGTNNFVSINNGTNNYVSTNNGTNNWVLTNNKYVNKIDSAYSSTSHVNESCAMDSVSNTSGLTTANFGKKKCHIVFDGFGHARLLQNKLPTITLGTGAGEGATYTLDSDANDQRGIITINSGTSPSMGLVFMINYAYPYKKAAYIFFEPMNAAAASTQIYGSDSSNTWGSMTSNTALVASTTYMWRYFVCQ